MKTIRIDRDNCIGCEKCVNACPGGALAMVDGKAKLVRQDHCDGLGVCLGECPADAITFEEVADAPKPAGCPGRMAKQFAPKTPSAETQNAIPSALSGWPIQLHLIQPTAPQFTGADVLIAASCTAFSQGDFHSKLLAGKGLIIACPKLDRQEGYAEKLTSLFRDSRPRSVTVARMEVPCCSGLTHLVHSAREQAGSDLPINEVTLSLQGEIIREEAL